MELLSFYVPARRTSSAAVAPSGRGVDPVGSGAPSVLLPGCRGWADRCLQRVFSTCKATSPDSSSQGTKSKSMFHTFESVESRAGATSPGIATSPATEARSSNLSERREVSSRRVITVRACTSCRHRKIKCDGDKPCEACRWYKKADSCHYPDPRPSRRQVDNFWTPKKLSFVFCQGY